MNYERFFYKSISELEPHWQQECEESRGFLLQVQEVDDRCIAVFDWGAISLPIELAGQLCKLTGKKIGVLRLDGYHVLEAGDDHDEQVGSNLQQPLEVVQ